MLLIATNYISRARNKRLWCAILAVLCLNGPFGVLSLPIIIFRFIIYRDFRRETLFYISMLLPITIQCVTLILVGTARFQTTASASLSDWYVGVVQNTIFQFIPNRQILFLFAVFLILLLRNIIVGGQKKIIFSSLALISLALINAAAGFYSYKYMPAGVGPFTTGERYFFIPFLLLIYFVLSSAEGWLRPVGILFVAYACLANVRPFQPGPESRGAGYWSSQVKMSRYTNFIKILEHPVWPDETWSYEIHNSNPLIPPIVERVDELSGNVRNLIATPLGHGGWEIKADISTHQSSKNLLTPSWRVMGLTSRDDGNGSVTANISEENSAMWQSMPGIERGGTLTFSFEARSDRHTTILPHLTDGLAGQSYTVELSPEWEQFVFDKKVIPLSAKIASAFITLGAAPKGAFEVRNLRVTFDPSGDRALQFKIPDTCRPFGNISLAYSASTQRPGFHKLSALSKSGESNEWNAVYRWVGREEKTVILALSNDSHHSLSVSVNHPVTIRDVVLRCY